MNKVICDICGTAYPDTAPKCPICGYAKTSTETTSAGAERHAGEGGYSAVRGGRFSKQNVRKRTSGKAPERTGNSERPRRSQSDEGGNTGLVLVVIFLLIAIIAVVIYIAIKFSKNNSDPVDAGTTPTSQTTDPTTLPTDPGNPTDPTNPTDGDGVACEGMLLSGYMIELTDTMKTWTIEARLTPANTTDVITFTSSAPDVVTVDSTGLVTAVGSGEATITVTCGTIVQTCQVKCSLTTTTTPTEPTTPTDPTTPTTPTPTGPVDPSFTFEFDTKWKDEASGKWDTSILEQGKTWKAYKKSLTVDPSAITWTTDDPSVCTIENGIVTAVSPGKTEVHATYGGKTYTCIVRCKFEADGTGTTTPTEPTTPAEPVDPNYEFEFNTKYIDEASGLPDSTQKVGETWKAFKKEFTADPGSIVWTSDDTSVCTIKDGIVTGVGVGKTKIHAQYGGKTYTCIVRVKAAD